VTAVRILDHISDIKIEVTAATIEGLYRESLEAMSSLMADLPMPGEKPIGSVAIKWDKLPPEEQLIEFLSEAISLSHTKKAVCLMEWIKFGEKNNQASLEFFQRDGFKTDVKAVTYHEASVEKLKEGGWRSVFILDI